MENMTPPTLEYLIRECEQEIRNCQELSIKYIGNNELTHIYSTKIAHYEFMICRLRRHLQKRVTPRSWCDLDDKLKLQEEYNETR